jgi:hypothetical protein
MVFLLDRYYCKLIFVAYCYFYFEAHMYVTVKLLKMCSFGLYKGVRLKSNNSKKYFPQHGKG